MKLDAKLLRPSILGGSDGLMSILGPVMFTASRYPRLVFFVALMGAVSASASMGAGELMSEESQHAPAVVAMGVATFAGSVSPAIPYLFCRGVLALALSGVVCFAVALVVGHLRSWRRHRYLETLAIIGFVFGITIVCNLLMPGGTG